MTMKYFVRMFAFKSLTKVFHSHRNMYTSVLLAQSTHISRFVKVSFCFKSSHALALEL